MKLLALEFPPVSELVEWPDIWLKGSPFAINKVVLLTLLSVTITLVLFFVAGSQGRLVPTGVQNVVEAAIDFVRDQIALQVMGPSGLPWVPFLTAMFFFILFNNLYEVIPGIQMPVSARMATPLFMALLVWILFNAVGVVKQGPLRYLKNTVIPPGVPAALLPLVALIEFFSVFLVRPFSLAVRLFANMFAGHLLLVTFAVISATMFARNIGVVLIMPVSAIMLVVFTAFEVLVALLQAFIFTILTAVYLDSSLHPHH